MSKFKETIQITAVWPGTVGGAIFKGTLSSSQNKKATCRASWKILTSNPKLGEFWAVEGNIVNDEEYGKQVNVTTCHLTDLPHQGVLRNYLLNNRAFRGFYFGDGKIKELIKEMGESALIQLLNEGKWQHIADIISEPIAKRLVEAWAHERNHIKTIKFLVEYKFPPQLATRIIKFCRSKTVERLKQNPYALVAFGGIAKNIWRTVEGCGQKLEIERDDPRRLVGAIEHAMYQRLRNGHTAATQAELIAAATKLLRTEKRAQAAINEALKQQALCVCPQNGETLFQAVGPAYIEFNLEQRLKQLQAGELQQPLCTMGSHNIDPQITAYSDALRATEGYSLTNEQQAAVTMALTERCSIITGYGGTGKTSVLKAVMDLATDQHRTVYAMALAGKTKERLSQATGHTATTIHGFISTAIQPEQCDGSPSVDLDCDPLIVIDEASMIDISLLNRLLALFDGRSYSLLTVGDPAQLSPVGFGLAWHRMINGQIPTTRLTKVHRQAAESPLHRIAMQIRAGFSETLPAWQGEIEGVFHVEANDITLDTVLTGIKQALPDSQVLTPHMTERLPDSGHKLNHALQATLNVNELADSPLQDGRPRLRVGRYQLFCGDPVLVTVTSYDLELYNGTTGKLITINADPEMGLTGTFEFDSQTESKVLTVEQCYDVGLTLAYAISIHKSQGSEYDTCVITSLVASSFVERSMLYTALTRSKQLCLVVGSRNIYHQASAAPPRADTLQIGFSLS